MIIETNNGKRFHTDRDLTAPERHILQKLFLWESMAESIEQFREKKEKALKTGWNGSGPVSAGPALKAICRNMENNIAVRLKRSKLEH